MSNQLLNNLIPVLENGKHTLSGFEGPEKTIEIWFKNNATSSFEDDVETPVHNSLSRSSTCSTEDGLSVRKFGLRSVGRNHWDDMLEIVKAQVLSTVSNESCDAYLLSESSMFVYPFKIVLKTCGTTTLLNALPKILQIAKDLCGLSEVDAFFYNRKAFLFPEKQIFPHGKWGDEVTFLEEVFPRDLYETAGYVIGKINGDHWCLYTATPIDPGLDNDNGEDEKINKNKPVAEEDLTLEIMMHGLDPTTMKKFWKSFYDGNSHNSILQATKISTIYPDAIIDDHSFDPCGYSLNGLLGEYYFTIHVTPEDHCSYASFETNIPVKQFYGHKRPIVSNVINEYETFEDVVSKVVEIFKPRSTTLFTLSSNEKLLGRQGSGLLAGNDGVEKGIKGFKLKDRVIHSVGDWELMFMHYKEKKHL
ncbi:AMP deaminase, partial [Clydaea vesicula]